MRHIILMAGAIVILLPFFFMVSASLKSPQEIFQGSLSLFPRHWQAIENYTRAFTEQPLLRFMINGAFVVTVIFLLQALIATPCAYALAKLKFKGRNFIFSLVLAGLLIPPQAISIPIFLLLWKMGVLNTYSALVIPWTISVIGIFLMRQFFLTVSDEIIDAARLDGMGELTIVWRLMVPTAVPALTAFAILSVVATGTTISGL